MIYRYRGKRMGVTALGGQKLVFDPRGFGDQITSPIKKRPTKDCLAFCSRQRSIVTVDEEMGMAILRDALKKSKAGSTEPVADAWEEVFGDTVPTVSQFAEDERIRTEYRRLLRKDHGVMIPDDDFLKMSSELLQKAAATKGQAYWQWKMDQTAEKDAPLAESALAQVEAKHEKKENPERSVKDELRTVLKTVAGSRGVELEVGAQKQIKPLWGVDRLLAEIAKYDEAEARAVGWKG